MSHDEDKRQNQKCICCGADTIWEVYGIPVCWCCGKKLEADLPKPKKSDGLAAKD